MDVYIDGACKGNPGPGGWAFYSDEDTYFSGFVEDTTNNRMEITAALEALKTFKEGHIHFITDSKYLKDAATVWIKTWYKNGWRTVARKPVKNKDLWLEYVKLARGRSISWTWVRGHAGTKGNERADQLASNASEKDVQISDKFFKQELSKEDLKVLELEEAIRKKNESKNHK